MENECWGLILEEYCEKLELNLILKKVFARFHGYFPHFQCKVNFISYYIFQCSKFDNAYSLATLNKVYKNQMEINNTIQTF